LLDDLCGKIVVLYTSVAEALLDVPEELRDSMDLGVHAQEVARVLAAGEHDARVLCWDDAVWPTLTALEGLQPEVIVNLAECPRRTCLKAPHVAAVLELLRLPYTGNGPLALALATDKARAKRLLRAQGIVTPDWAVCAAPPEQCPMPFPLIVKPVYEDGSLGITEDSVVENLPQLRERVACVIAELQQPALVEGFLPGREFQIAMLGNGTPDDPHRLLPPAEVLYQPGWRLVSYAAKWEPDHPAYAGTPTTCPADLSPKLAERLEELGRRCAEAFGLTGYARMDVRLDARGEPHVLEVNPNPDLSEDAGFANTARAAGLSYEALLWEIVRLGRALGGR